MRYPTYDSYKENQYDWLGKLPNHWGKFSIKRKFRIINGSTPKSGESEYWDGELIWVTPADFSKQKQGSLSKSDRQITQAGLESCGTTLVKENSIILSTRAPIGEVVQATDELCTNQGCKSLVVDPPEILERFYFYSLKVSSEQLNILGLGTTFMELSKDALGYYPVAFPPIDEQQKIAAFLDYKTQQIDQLIEKKKALIEKLEEKRIAVITQAVTKGLDKNVTLKPSGVDWLGDVPAHWEVRRLKFLSRDTLQYGANEAAEMDDSDQPRFIRITDVKLDGTLHEDTFRSIPKDIAEPFILAEGDILLARSGATVGKSFIYSKEWGIAAYAGYLIRFRVDVDVMNADYAYQFFQTSTFWANINSTLIQSTIQNFSAEKYANILMPLPSKHEQKEILTYLKVILTKLDGMTKKANDVIAKLEEYRSALITSAVTGKIDVRNVQIPKEVA